MLFIGTLMPFVYFTILFGLGAFNPEYSNIRQAPSDLGADGAPYRMMAVFNAGLVLAGGLGIVGGIGLIIGLRNLDFGRFFACAASLTVIMPSINMILSGVFPLPNPNHSFLEVMFPVFFAPLFAGLIIRRISDKRLPAIILFIGFILNIFIFAGIIGIGSFVGEDNLGLWIRIWTFIIMPSSGYMCWTVRSKL
ncbi:MAG: DUF998 domain-containing protein [Kordiimonadaceae bacterium]|nr:DUF998 domain-containing protein [Kordiimonadaceae bacterium]